MQVDETKKVEFLNLSNKDIVLQCPFRCLIYGPSSIGKTYFIYKMLKNKDKMFSETFNRIIYFMPSSMFHFKNEFVEKLRRELPTVEIEAGLPNIKALGLSRHTEGHTLFIIDDLMTELSAEKQMFDLFRLYSHHLKISCFVTSQAYFQKGPYSTSIQRNATYQVIFYNKSEENLMILLAKTIKVGNPRFLLNCFSFLFTHFPFAHDKYLIIDCFNYSPLPKNMNVYSRIFPLEEDGQKISPIFFFPA